MLCIIIFSFLSLLTKLYNILGVAIRAGPVRPTCEKNAGRDRVVSPQAHSGLTYISSQPMQAVPRAGPQARITRKKLALVYINYFFMDSCINISNSCITGKDKYYVFFNVLKFKEYIVYVIV